MSYPVMLEGKRFTALVVGGGPVAARKVQQLLDGGVRRVVVVAPDCCDQLLNLRDQYVELSVIRRAYEPDDLADHLIVIASTNDAKVNAAVAGDAHSRGRLVNVANEPNAGNFVTPSVHRSGDLTVAVSTGRVPAAAAAIRRAIATRFDDRYAVAISRLRALRERLLGNGHREEWARASRELVADNFCDDVESGALDAKVAAWP